MTESPLRSQRLLPQRDEDLSHDLARQLFSILALDCPALPWVWIYQQTGQATPSPDRPVR